MFKEHNKANGVHMRIGAKEARPKIAVPVPIQNVPIEFRVDLPNGKTMNLSELQQLLTRGRVLAKVTDGDGDIISMAALAAGDEGIPVAPSPQEYAKLNKLMNKKKGQARKARNARMAQLRKRRAQLRARRAQLRARRVQQRATSRRNLQESGPQGDRERC